MGMTSPDRKLSEYDINQHSTITLSLSDDCEWTPAPTKGGPDVVAHRETAQRSAPARSNRDEPVIRFLTYQSKIHCRILLLVFQISLILLVSYWGTLYMVQFTITIIFVLIGWRGCRKLL